jgi:hypothetical protein
MKPIRTYDIKLWGALSIQTSPFYSECTFARKQPQDPWKSTKNHSAKRNENVECQLEIYNKALAMNLLDNSETTHRLKMYSVLTVPDRIE